MSPQELSEFFVSMGEKSFRAQQIMRWIYQFGVTDFDEMSNLNKVLRAKLKETCVVTAPEIVTEQKASDGTTKWALDIGDGQLVETVLIPEADRNTLCISTQVGCPVKCAFCRTGAQGFNRNLTVNEIIGQVFRAATRVGFSKNEEYKPISNVVMMGMGEPLDNYDNVVRFIRLVNSEDSLNIGARHITLSTCGLVPKIYALAKEGLPINLAVSLHAPNDEIRARTMPIAKVYPMDELLKACRDYFDTTGRRVTFEYAMIDGVNDSDECARELALRLGGMSCHVNLIPVNTVEGTGYSKSKLERQQSFVNILEGRGIAATVRRTLGSDINASCGQLRRKHLKKEDK